MILILYISVAVIAAAFLVLVIFLSRVLKSLQKTLESVSGTLAGLEKQFDEVMKESTVLLQRTNAIVDDVQRKSERVNSVVDAVKDVGTTISHFNQTLQRITNTVDVQVEKNEDKISQVVQWGNVFLELKDKWKSKKKRHLHD